MYIITKKIINRICNMIVNLCIFCMRNLHELLYSIVNFFKPSDVEFYLIDTMEIMHEYPIYKKFLNLGYRVFFVCEKNIYNVSGKWFDYETAKDKLNELNVNVRYGVNRKTKYAFSTQDADILKKYKNTIKVNVSYGVTFLKNGYLLSSETVEGFNYRLVHGEYQKLIADRYNCGCEAVIFGYPKHFRETTRNKSDILSEKGIITEKPILVYFPTWDENCSAIKFCEAFSALRDRFYIITKYHHCLERLEECAEKRKCIESFSDLILSGNSNFTEAVLVADIALCDAKSGSSTEVPYINEKAKVILLSMEENIDQEYYEGIYHLGPIVSNPKDLAKVVFEEQDDMKKKRKDLMLHLFGDKNKDYLDEAIAKITEGDINGKYKRTI